MKGHWNDDDTTKCLIVAYVHLCIDTCISDMMRVESRHSV